jgi:hypothetical protein
MLEIANKKRATRTFRPEKHLYSFAPTSCPHVCLSNFGNTDTPRFFSNKIRHLSVTGSDEVAPYSEGG